MGCSSRSALICLSGLCLVFGGLDSVATEGDSVAPVTPSVDAAQARKEYQQWVRKYSAKTLDGLKLAITAIEGEEKANDHALNPFGSDIFKFGCRVLTDGDVSHFFGRHSGFISAGEFMIAPADFKRLNELLEKLPDDGSRLPPAGRRLIVQALEGSKWTINVYDRANLSDDVLEIIRLSDSRILSWMPKFQPQSKIESHPYEWDGFLCLSPDGSQVIFTCGDGPLQFWEPITHETLGDVPTRGMPHYSIAFNKDGSQAALCGRGTCTLVDTKKWKQIWKYEEPSVKGVQKALSNPLFTPDGKFLVMQSSEPSLRIFDTHTWERVGRLPDMLEDATQYAPALKKKLAVVRSKSGVISLWNLDRHAALADLDKGCFVSQAAFSPDESLLAVVTTEQLGWKNPRLRLWKTDDGKLVSELRPFEQLTSCEKIQCLFWSPDGQYLLAAIKGNSTFIPLGIGVWNVKTGRHRGHFTGSGSDVIGIVLLADGSELVAGCTDGVIRFWDFPAAMKQIHDFENSLQHY